MYKKIISKSRTANTQCNETISLPLHDLKFVEGFSKLYFNHVAWLAVEVECIFFL